MKGNEGIQFENLVATCLLKHTFAKTDYEAKPYALHYLHTKERHEVDFALALDQKVEKMIEVKLRDPHISASLIHFFEKYKIPAIQVVKDLKREKIDREIEIISGDSFLKSLYL